MLHVKKMLNAAAAILQRIGPDVIFPSLATSVFFLAASRLDWAWGWVYLGVNLVNVLIVGTVMVRSNLRTALEASKPEMRQGWDAGSVFYLLAMYIALPFVAGLHVRFGWGRGLDIAWHMAGVAVFALGLAVTTWAMATNAYIWSQVLVQEGQTVCNIGPYRYVRHPAYQGSILQALGIPILLGSFWALVPGFAAAVCMIIATSSEDQLLQAGLPGYQDYVRKVRFRLVPGVW